MKINEEGFLEKIVDNFFSALKRGVADRYINAAEKAGIHPDVANYMKEMEKNRKLIDKLMKK
jgi:hypothetical protein